MNVEHIPGYLCISAGLFFGLLAIIRQPMHFLRRK